MCVCVYIYTRMQRFSATRVHIGYLDRKIFSIFPRGVVHSICKRISCISPGLRLLPTAAPVPATAKGMGEGVASEGCTTTGGRRGWKKLCGPVAQDTGQNSRYNASARDMVRALLRNYPAFVATPLPFFISLSLVPPPTCRLLSLLPFVIFGKIKKRTRGIRYVEAV